MTESPPTVEQQKALDLIARCPDCGHFVGRTPVGVEREVERDEDGAYLDVYGIFECRLCDDVFAARVDDDDRLILPVETVYLSGWLRTIYTTGIEIPGKAR